MSAEPQRRWIALALEPAVVRRGLRVASVVGTILCAINYADRAFEGRLSAGDFLKMALTYCVPYGVSTYASVEALRSRG